MSEDSGGSERVQASVWVSEDQRDEWDLYAEELGFESRGAMIRNAVRYFYFSQTEGDNQRILNRLSNLDTTAQNIESKTDSIKIDQLEQGDIDIIADEVEYRVIGGLLDVLGEADSIGDIQPRSSDE